MALKYWPIFMGRRLPPLDLLVSFEAAARQLSFSKAGEEIHVTQSAISRQVKKLEESLGFALFERLHRELKLTEQGQILYETVQDSLESLARTVANLKQEKSLCRVKVSTNNPFSALWLVPKLADFRSAHPEIELDIDSNNRLVDLKQDIFNVAIRYTTLESVKEKDYLYLSGEDIFPVCSPAFLKKMGTDAGNIESLRFHTLLHLNDPKNAWPWLQWANWLESAGYAPAVGKGYRFSHVDQMIQAATIGQGIALGSSPLVDALLEQGLLVAPFATSISSPRSFIACFGPRKDESTMAFINWVQATINASRSRRQKPVRG
ncbi:LysR substrate-binding domain-containing protein [Herbaspirillum chlorophenolicum]|uniref:LysR substrate-binding domain-containing protein n=1 Tax=Herbaspirillum chlorophenolicum TaxID=211589 RepID=UPI001E467672|nr:LysR substrate-binding domain-containing protein [Herbaspirillum chlorophenolicum]